MGDEYYIVQLWGFLQFQNCTNCELIGIRNSTEYLTVHVRKKSPAARRNSTMQVTGIVSERVFNESAVNYSSQAELYTQRAYGQ